MRRSRVYYNDNDEFCIAWLHELMKDGLIPKGELDNRSILEIQPNDIINFDQCHFFAGIGGWAYACQLAKWKEPIWTASFPCQPWSIAGKRKALADERHLWPIFPCLVEKCKPSTIVGEQVASKTGYIWLSGIRSDLETLDYAFGAANLCAASIGAPHIRQRLFWVASSNNRKKRDERFISQKILGEQSFSWCKNVRRVEDLRGRSDLPEPLICSYSNGVPNGVGIVGGAGNAIVPQLAAEFLMAFREI